jgi:WD40 repeat protein
MKEVHTETVGKDIRSTGPCQIVLSSPGDASRDFLFSPCPGAPYTVASVSEGGLLARWDLRKASTPVDRLQAHVGAALGLDWKAGDREGGGWSATAGMDGTVKVRELRDFSQSFPLTWFLQIWDMSSPNLQASRPVHVLNPSRPVARAAWRLGEHPTELAIIPLASSAVSASESDPDIILDGVGLATGGWTSWVDEIELWDVRREHVAKYAFKSGEGAPSGDVACLLSCLSQAHSRGRLSGLVFPTASCIWTTHKSSGTFVQHAIELDGKRPLDYLPRCAVGWSAEGRVAFAAARRCGDEVPFDEQ